MVSRKRVSVCVRASGETRDMVSATRERLTHHLALSLGGFFHSGSFGPFPRTSSYSPAAQGSYRDSIASSDVAVDVLSPTLSYEYGRNSPPSDEEEEDRRPMKDRLAEARKSVDATLLWDKQNAEVDDYLHEPDADLDRYLDRQMASYSVFGVINTVGGWVLGEGGLRCALTLRRSLSSAY